MALVGCSSDGDSDDSAAPSPTEAPATSEPTATTSPAEPDPTAGEEAPPEEADEEPDEPEATEAGVADFTAEDFAALAICTVPPEATTGPFPLDEQLFRRDITEGYDGHAVRLGLRVTDASCTPVPGAEVEIWHSDATGDYSAFEDGGTGKDEGEGTTFCRGTQTADDAGIVEFGTIYPGWYPGRTPHIHVRVRVGGDTALVTQLYFDDSYTSQIYGQGVYAEFGQADTTNATDGLAGDVATDGSLLELTPGPTRVGQGTIALANLGINV